MDSASVMIAVPVGTDDPDGLPAVASAKAQLGRAEQAINDQDMLIDAAVDDLRLALGADDENRGHLALHDAARKFDIDAAAVVIDGDRFPWWRAASHRGGWP
ncbi:hypothetical protein GCM10017653_11060 [Ancylobacter defluvii]|uniref:Uncharacterized protein n=1 Tax=Ancylobacter defluvii TaxID=1282440 RepID=A0A9W6N9Z7_9HYPH|nr:hypothetical protein GCM10017653_11060 [Ancylobacter defluvii]